MIPRSTNRTALFAVVLMALFSPSSRGAPALTWGMLPQLPPSPGRTVQPGVAGPFVGVHHGALIVAGGANFPDRPPWDGGVKAWWDDVFVLQRDAGGSAQWVGGKHFKLPRAMGYGASFSTPDGVICAGGCDGDRCYSDVFILSWDPVGQELSTHFLPSLPGPLAFMGFARVGDTLYVAGGQQATKGYVSTRSFWSLDLAKKSNAAEFRWKVLPPIPGPARVVPVAAAQEVGRQPRVLPVQRADPGGRQAHDASDRCLYLPALERHLAHAARGRDRWRRTRHLHHGRHRGPLGNGRYPDSKRRQREDLHGPGRPRP